MKKWKVAKTASRGVAIGPAYPVKQEVIEPDLHTIENEQAENEIAKYEEAVETVAAELGKLAEESAIFAAHLMLAQDFALREGVVGKIRDGHDNAQLALWKTKDEFVAMFESMGDEYMRERAADMKDVATRLLCAMKGIHLNPFEHMERQSIVVANDLAPSDTAKMDMKKVLGFITEVGGTTSHVSIIAKNLGIPCLVGAGPILGEIKEGDQMIMDAGLGDIFLEPEEARIKEYQEKEEQQKAEEARLESISRLPSETKDGRKFQLCANVGNPDEVDAALQYQLDGVGLFRSEFLYMDNTHFPTEDEQFEAYKKAAELLDGKELTIRTLDIGGDKSLDYYEFPKEDNPFLGYRAIRICLDQENIFETQLRAILRASAFGYIRIMYPMMISIEELRKANVILKRCCEQLDDEGIAYDGKIQVGMMIETPAAVLMAEQFSKYVDFFSIGTNDLTQYVLAVDRGNQKIAEMYDSFHPAVLRAIYHTIQVGHKHDTKVGMCGEFASDAAASKLLLGMGLDEFSMSASEIARVKEQLRDCSYQEAAQAAEKAMQAETIEEIKKIVEDM